MRNALGPLVSRIEDIRIDAFKEYLTDTDWVLERSDIPSCTIWRHPSSDQRVNLPVLDDGSYDTTARKRIAVYEVAEVEGRPEDDVASDLIWQTIERSRAQPAPTEEVETAWGVLYATSTGADEVWFSTIPPDKSKGAQNLVFHEASYSATMVARRGDAAQKAHGRAERVIDDWHFVPFGLVATAPRHAAEPVISQAETELRGAVLPRLAGWLDSDDGRALLADGATHERVGLHAEMQLAQDVVRSALRQLMAVTERLQVVGRVADEDVKLVRSINAQALSPEWRHIQPRPLTPRPTAIKPDLGGLGL